MEIEKIVQVEVSDDFMGASLVILSPDGLAETALDEVVGYVQKEAGLTGMTRESLAALLERRDQWRRGGRIPLCMGRTPVPGRDGEVEWIVPNPETLLEEVRSGKHELGDAPLCKWVKEGDPLVRMHPPTLGKAGVDIYGKTLPAADGHAAEILIGAGAKVSGGGVIVADRAGTLHVTGRRLFVVATLRLMPGEVERSKEAAAPGWMLIAGDAVGLPLLRSALGIEVLGSLEGNEVVTEGDLFVHGVVAAGSGGRLVHAGRTVLARELISARIEAGENVIILGNSSGSELVVSGRLELKRGALIGGRATVGQGAEIFSMGNPRGTRTQMTFGADPLTEEKLHEVSRKIDAHNAKVEEIQHNIDYHVAHKRTLSPEEAEAMTGWYFEIEKLKEQGAALKKRAAAWSEKLQRAREARVWVAQVIHPGVEFECRGQSLLVDRAIRGPVQILHDARQKELRVEFGRG
ncbi:MAG: DUF342 domain-containing protein [Nitrospirae bacterium]|nr:DUF342 domain-containing protein [Nitrospirota bacterium]